MQSTTPRTQLRLLGDLELTFDGEPIVLSQPAQRVLANLAVVHRGRPARRAALAERLWPEATGTRASSNLRSVLWRLPRPRGRAFVTGTSTSVRLHEDVAVDLWHGEALACEVCAAEPRPVAATAELSPLRNDLLPGWDEDWLVGEQEAYRQQRLHALERVAAAWCRDGRYTDALSAGLVAVRSEPLRESAHRRVIEVHLAEGNHAEALRQYDGYRRLLAAELGLRPSPAIRVMVAPLLGRPVDFADPD